MGEPDEVWAERLNDLMPYQVNKAVMDQAKGTAIFMHCLPAFHDLKTKIGKEVYEKFGYSELEVTDEVFESAQSVVLMRRKTECTPSKLSCSQHWLIKKQRNQDHTDLITNVK